MLRVPGQAGGSLRGWAEMQRREMEEGKGGKIRLRREGKSVGRRRWGAAQKAGGEGESWMLFLERMES